MSRELSSSIEPSSSTGDAYPPRDSEMNFKECLKPSCHLRRVNNKGAILVIVWSYLVLSIYYYGEHVAATYCSDATYLTLVAVIGLTMPLAGWLADVRFGRYKVLSCSLWVMWITSILLAATLTIAEVTELRYKEIPIIALLVILAVGCGGFQANILQFGIDQLHDASASQLKSFVAWYSWTFLASGLVVSYVAMCVQNRLALQLMISCNLTLSLILNLLFNKVLIKEPSTQNPFKLVYRVVCYAIKHKYPRQRSAFTYCEDDVPSRINFGKSKYGGPFTTEQVEDVKTLFRVFLVLLVGCAVYSISREEHFSKYLTVNKLFLNDRIQRSLGECSLDFITSGLYFIVGTAMVPLHELVVNPLFHRCLPNPQSTHKFIMGAILRIGNLLILLTLVTVARYSYQSTGNGRRSLPCLFHGPVGFLGAYVDYRWSALPQIMYAASDLMIFIGTLEFICAQVPYSMKGLVLGTTFALLGLYLPTFTAMQFIFKKKSVNWGTGVVSCGFWYFLTKLFLQVATSVAIYMMIKLYKKRKREDVLPNEQIFAERYYSY